MDPLTIIAALSTLAPQIIKWVGGGKDIQEVATKASDLALRVTGLTNVPSAVDALEHNPELLVQYQKAIVEADLEYERIYQNDKANARQRDLEIIRSGRTNIRSNFLVVITCLVIFVILAVVIKGSSQLDEYAKGILTTILGVFLNQLTNIFAFEFGTTRKSSERNDALTRSVIDSSTIGAK